MERKFKMKITELNNQIVELRAKANAKRTELRALATAPETPVEDVQSGMASLSDIESQLEALLTTLEAYKSAQSLPDDDTESNDTDDTDNDNEERNFKGAKKMPIIKPNTNNTAEIEERNFIHYLKSGEKRDGLTTVDTAIAIPKTILNVQTQPADETGLAKLVNRVTVATGQGSLPVLLKNTARLLSTAELAENPELEKPSFKDVDYKLTSYRGALKLSFEAVQDYAEIKSIVANFVSEAKALTEQYAIGGILKQAVATPATTADDLKTAFNTGLTNYQKQWIVSESFYNQIDLLKDAQGRYLLQDSIASATGKSLFGAPVTVVPDDVLGVQGQATAFVGDPKAFALETVNGDVAVEWIKNEDFSTNFAVLLRADFKAADDKAGKFITFGAQSGK